MRRSWHSPRSWVKLVLVNSKVIVLKLIYGGDSHRLIFTEIFENNTWGGSESRSGTGSSLQQTVLIRTELPNLLTHLRVRHFLDIPCGDFQWMKEVQLPPGVTYMGGDIVSKLINRNTKHYGDRVTSFRIIDLLSDPLPKSDLVLCRDCLVHFCFSDIAKAIENLKNSHSAYLLTTHFTGDRSNKDIRTGKWRPLKLTSPPFNFPPPLLILDEQCSEMAGTFKDKCLALWRLKELPYF